MEPKVISTRTDYEAALKEIENLSSMDLSPSSPQLEKLKLLATLVQTFEKEQFKFELPDPIEAIKFRMEEQGLQQSDLVPYIGSKSKVSEVLSQKRPLTLSMIRALVDGLGISPEVLIQKSSNEDLRPSSETKLPIKEMINKGWLPNSSLKAPAQALANFFAPFSGLNEAKLDLYWRKSTHCTSQEKQKEYLIAWTAQILSRASKVSIGTLKIRDADTFTK